MYYLDDEIEFKREAKRIYNQNYYEILETENRFEKENGKKNRYFLDNFENLNINLKNMKKN